MKYDHLFYSFYSLYCFKIYCFYFLQTGHIRTSTGSYFIEPVEKWVDHATPIMHKFYKVGLPPASLNKTPRQPSNCAVDGEFFI